ncbi:MAG: hypothetical protein ACE5ES_00590, partial [Candidatus Nanoarchaeia archaeon]
MSLKAKHVLILLIVISFAASYFFPGVGENRTIETSITFIGILFGIIVGFFITDLYSRYSGIRDNAAIDSSALSTYWAFANIIAQNKKNKKWLEEQRKLINNYVHKFMPLPWHRYEETEKEFSALVSSFGTVNYNTDKQNETYSNMLAILSQQSDAR